MKKTLCALIAFIALFCGSYIAMEWYQAYLYHQTLDIKELSKYPNFVGILQIDGVLSEPVMASDDAYYLTHSYDGSENPNGCVFTSSHNKDSNNLVLYGHNSHNGTVFSNLLKYMDSDFASQNRKAVFLRKDGTKIDYELVLVYNYNTNDAGVSNPYLPEYPKDYLSRFSYYTTYFQDGNIEGNILTLSTCEESLYGQAGRLILVWKEASYAD